MMKNKKLKLSDFSKKVTTLSDKEQVAVKGGNKFTGNLLSPITTKWIEVDIRGANPDPGWGNYKDKSLKLVKWS
jgi:natural product precursor